MRYGRWIVGTLLAGAATAGCSEDGGAPELTVMTLNAYYGFAAEPLLAAESPEQIPGLAAQAYGQLLLTDMPGRAEAVAAEIARRRPHLVGLQEAATIRVQSPGDAVAGGDTPATEVVFDYLDLLLKALAKRGLDYRIAGRIENVEVELPMVTGVEPLTFDDVRLTDSDAVLARGDVATSNVAAAHFSAALEVPSLGLLVPRGYVAVDADLGGGRVVRFVTTHLEDTPFPAVQTAQAAELAGMLSTETKPLVLTGDFNSAAPSGDTYGFLAAQGFEDAWSAGTGEGFTWGHAPDLANAAPALTQRIDVVFTRAGALSGRPVRLEARSADVWGDELDERAESGLWASDHAAVVAGLRFKAEQASKEKE